MARPLYPGAPTVEQLFQWGGLTKEYEKLPQVSEDERSEWMRKLCDKLKSSLIRKISSVVWKNEDWLSMRDPTFHFLQSVRCTLPEVFPWTEDGEGEDKYAMLRYLKECGAIKSVDDIKKLWGGLDKLTIISLRPVFEDFKDWEILDNWLVSFEVWSKDVPSSDDAMKNIRLRHLLATCPSRFLQQDSAVQWLSCYTTSEWQAMGLGPDALKDINLGYSADVFMSLLDQSQHVR